MQSISSSDQQHECTIVYSDGHMHLEYIAHEPIQYSQQECVTNSVTVKAWTHTQHIPLKIFKEHDAELNTQFSRSIFFHQHVCNHQHYSYVVIISKIVNGHMCPLINMSFVHDTLRCGQLVLTQPMVYTFSFSTDTQGFWVRYKFHIHYNEASPEDKIYLTELYTHGLKTFVPRHPHCFLLRDGKDIDIQTATRNVHLAVNKYSNASLIITFSSISSIRSSAQTRCNGESTNCHQQHVSIHKMRTIFLHYIAQYGKMFSTVKAFNYF